jgi:hypothetical protein
MNGRALSFVISIAAAFAACGPLAGDDKDEDRGELAGDNLPGGRDTSSRDPTAGDPMNIEDDGIPADYPQLNTRFASHGTWAIDHSGYEIIPNRVHASIDELEPSEGGETYGAIWDTSWSSFVIAMYDAPRDQTIELLLPSLDPGEYDLTAWSTELRYTERGGYLYKTAIDGGRGTVTIAGANGRALWGEFSGRVCFVSTPGSNCFSIYRGKFSARDQRPEEMPERSAPPAGPGN